MPSIASLLIYLVVGFFGGMLGLHSKLPAGTMLGAVISVMAVKCLFNADWALPRTYGFVCQVMLGVLVASTYSPGLLRNLGGLLWPMVFSTVGLILCGIVIAAILAKIYPMDSATAYIATSPGGMSALVPMAADIEVNPALIAGFHFFRIFLVVITAPVVFKIIKIFQEYF